MMGGAFSLACFALPCNSGTGGTLLRGWVWVHSGRDMPCFATADHLAHSLPREGWIYPEKEKKHADDQ